jgi:hypothetical protein
MSKRVFISAPLFGVRRHEVISLNTNQARSTQNGSPRVALQAQRMMTVQPEHKDGVGTRRPPSRRQKAWPCNHWTDRDHARNPRRADVTGRFDYTSLAFFRKEHPPCSGTG